MRWFTYLLTYIFGWGRIKPAISVERLKIDRKLLLAAYIKSYTGFRLPPKCMTLNDLCARLMFIYSLVVWLGGVAVGRGIRHQEVASSIPGCSATRCNSGQVVHIRVPLFTKQYKLVPASAGSKETHRAMH